MTWRYYLTISLFDYCKIHLLSILKINTNMCFVVFKTTYNKFFLISSNFVEEGSSELNARYNVWCARFNLNLQSNKEKSVLLFFWCGFLRGSKLVIMESNLNAVSVLQHVVKILYSVCGSNRTLICALHMVKIFRRQDSPNFHEMIKSTRCWTILITCNSVNFQHLISSCMINSSMLVS